MSIATLIRGAPLCAGALFALPACTVRTGPPTADAYVYSQPPSAVYGAPRGYYAGNTYYYYENRWWYESPRGWAYLRDEPAPLYRYRSSDRYRPGVAQPPPAYGRPYGYGGGPKHVPPPLPAPR